MMKGISMSVLSDAWIYGLNHLEELSQAFIQHIHILVMSLGLAILFGLPTGILAAQSERISDRIQNLIAGIRVIPSLAILFLVVPYLGLETRSAVFALTVLAIPPVFINTTIAFRTIDSAMLEAAKGMGMERYQIFWQIKVPVALPTVFTGIRIAAIEVTASATLAAFVGSGGLGIYIVRGFAQYDPVILIVGALPIALLTLVVENLLVVSQRLMTPKIS